jgi:hypothetical protein
MPLNPQQQIFKKHYCSPKSDTFGNAYQSALKAGFKEEYAKVITAQNTEWFSEILSDMEMLSLAENALREAMEYDVKNGGEKVDPGVASIKLKAATFSAERLGKDRYSTRTETDVTSGGLPLQALPLTPAIAEATKEFEEKIKKSVLE